MASRLTVISHDVGVDLASLSVVKETVNPIPSECPAFRRTCLVGLTDRENGLAFQLNFSGSPLRLPENKKPGVERRAQSLLLSDFARSSTDSSPCCS